jgi:glycosyltransferase involved in cell wall biosynthesis
MRGSRDPGDIQGPMAGPVLSLVLPVFNEEAIIPELDRRLRGFLAGVGSGVGESWEVIFVDDGSKDRSLAQLKELAAREPRYKVLSLSRNFGHQMAITAGLDRADGDACRIRPRWSPRCWRAGATVSTSCSPCARGATASRRSSG